MLTKKLGSTAVRPAAAIPVNTVRCWIISLMTRPPSMSPNEAPSCEAPSCEAPSCEAPSCEAPYQSVARRYAADRSKATTFSSTPRCQPYFLALRLAEPCCVGSPQPETATTIAFMHLVEHRSRRRDQRHGAMSRRPGGVPQRRQEHGDDVHVRSGSIRSAGECCYGAQLQCDAPALLVASAVLPCAPMLARQPLGDGSRQ